MGIFDFWKKGEVTESYEYSPTLIVDEQSMALEQTNKPVFRGEVEKKERNFPTELGEEHPFDFATCEGLYKKFGFITAVIDKYIDFVVGPGFYVECDDEDAKKIIEDFIQDVNLDVLLRAWLKESLVKGNGFMEIGGKKDESPKGMKVLDSKYMYIKRNDKGVVDKYKQYVGGFKKFESDKVISFEPYEIGHIGINKIGDCPYGIGIISPALTMINNLLQNESDSHTLIKRKANNPYDVKMGGVFGGKLYKPRQSDVDAFGKKLEWLHNKHEWVHDGLTEIKALDFGNIGEKFESMLNHDVQMLFYAFQIPPTIMGMEGVPEGLAKVQMDGFERRISSIQAEAEKVLENDIFKRVLLANGLDVHVEFQWGRPSTIDKYDRLAKLTEIMKLPTVSESMSKLIERDMVKLLDYNEKEYEEMSEEEERRREEERPQPIVPGQNENPPQFIPKGGKPKKVNMPVKQDICPHHLDIKEGQYNTIQEWLGFNYKDYLKKILEVIKDDDFDLLSAKTTTEAEAGKLTEKQINKLKGILEKGFKSGESMRNMAKRIDITLGLQDLYRMKDGKIELDSTGVPKLSRGKENRSINIVRSEVTRIANKGALEHYKENGIKNIKWVASIGSRTCPECESLNGRIYKIGEQPDIPLHPMCRCTIVPVTELG